MTAEELSLAAMERKSVTGFHSHIDRPMPAAFIVAMPFRLVFGVLPRLKIYKSTKRPWKWTIKP